jgi:hypothetical protein
MHLHVGMSLRRLPAGLFFASILGLAASSVACTAVTDGESASSDVTSAVALKGEAPMFPGVTYDTGLVPEISPAQVQLEATIGGALKVSADGHRDGEKLEGNKGSGKLAIDLHAKLEGRLKVTSTFKNYDGDIPGLKDIDIAAVAEVPFDPFLLGDGEEVEAVANVPETKLPDVPLGGVPGHLELTVKTGSIVKAKLHGSCLRGAEKIATYSGATTTSGTLVLEAKVVLDLPAPLDKGVTVPAISIDLPETKGTIESKSEASASVSDFSAGACSAGTTTPAAEGTEPASGTNGEAAKTGDTAQCSAIANTAPTVEIEIVKGELPSALGGKIVEGTYALTAVRAYDSAADATPGPTGETIKRTIKISAGTWEAATEYGGKKESSKSTFVTASGYITRDLSCPKPATTYEDQYTATATTISLIDTAGAVVYTYGKQ